jgi:hypothetical protein
MEDVKEREKGEKKQPRFAVLPVFLIGRKESERRYTLCTFSQKGVRGKIERH